jgi:2-polyprenyl-3-methyl-5-hydroxy-6-metoxy-1,4-benzoquinol methylase
MGLFVGPDRRAETPAATLVAAHWQTDVLPHNRSVGMTSSSAHCQAALRVVYAGGAFHDPAMSLLINLLRVLLPGKPRTAVTNIPERLDAPRVGPSSAAPVPDAAPAWRQLGAETGVQQISYGEFVHPGVPALFGRPPRRLLDIGCGSGAMAASLKQSMPGLWAWGCELSPWAQQLAAARLDHFTAVPRAQWCLEDIALLSSIDTVLLLDVLEHMYNPWAELEFLADHLPPEAQVIVSLPNIGHLSILRGLSAGSFPYEPTGILDVTHVRFFTFAEMQTMFDQTGFQVEDSCVLGSLPTVPIDRFPAKVAMGKLVLDVDSAEEWERLNAIQFGFRLVGKPRAVIEPKAAGPL